MTMKTINTKREMKLLSNQFRCESPDKKIAMVPTMGFLHEGHLSLIQIAKKRGDLVVVSIFVNPIQFNDPSDLEKYPRDENADIEKLRDLGVDILFKPGVNDVYPNGDPEIRMDYPKITSQLCGKNRPGHFSGVLTVVHNLFQWVKPHIAIFGEKDYQQLLLIRKMNNELEIDVEIISSPTVRESGGLAMSSRNSRLSEEGRQKAVKINIALREGFELWKKIKETNAAKILEQMIDQLQQAQIEIDYIGLYDLNTLANLEMEKPIKKCLVACAVFVDGVRLIDNLILE